MTKYIDADAFKKFTMECAKEPPVNAKTLADAYQLCEVIDLFPAAPVCPEVHSYWKLDETVMDSWHCSSCGGSALCNWVEEPVLSPYCPHCAATMDGKKEDA